MGIVSDNNNLCFMFKEYSKKWSVWAKGLSHDSGIYEVAFDEEKPDGGIPTCKHFYCSGCMSWIPSGNVFAFIIMGGLVHESS